jgi:ribosome-binding factor A
MSQRVAKVESLIQAVVASALPELLERDAAAVTVTRVDASPDLRHATVWVGLLGDETAAEMVWKRLEGVRGELQAELARHMTTKFVPRVALKRDTGGEYSVEIERLLRGQ